MILVDTSVWIDHFRNGNKILSDLLVNGDVYTHPFVVGELACGNLKNRKNILSLFSNLSSVYVADNQEALHFIEKNHLMGKGLGLIDIHLLASCIISDALLWTLDKRLAAAAHQMRLEYKWR
jgi:predicted nucleic acid-binding protein